MSAVLLPAVLASSVVGSVHCVAMCGPLLSLVPAAPRAAARAPRAALRLAAAHAAGRLATYVALGAAAGALGRAVELAGRLAAIQRAATLAAGVAIIAWGAWGLAVAAGVRRTAPAPTGALFRRGLVQLRTRRAASRAALLGALTGLLPCGWLWAFVVAAAGAGGAVGGAALMATFWLGTAPAMLGALAFGGPALAWLRARLPVVTPLVLVALGIATLTTRWADAGVGQITHPRCHDPAAAGPPARGPAAAHAAADAASPGGPR